MFYTFLSERIGEFAALSSAFSFTFASLTFEYASKKIGALSSNFLTLFIAFLCLSALGILQRGIFFPVDATLHTWAWLSLSGFVGFNIGGFCLFRAFMEIGSRISMLIMCLVPPITALISWPLTGETLSLLDLCGMFFAMGGVVFVLIGVRKGESLFRIRYPTHGVLLAVIGAVTQALGIVFSKLGMGDYNPFAATHIRITAGLFGFVVLFTLIGWWPKLFQANRHSRVIGLVLLGGFLGPFLGASMTLVALQHAEAGVVSTISSLVPVFIIPVSVLVYREKVTAREVFGALVAVAGTVLLFL